MKSGLGGMTEEMEKQLAELDAVLTPMIHDEMEGSWPGTQETRGDDQFKQWFAVMLKGYGPDWVRALEYVDGGPEVLKRWVRLMEVQSGAAI